MRTLVIIPLVLLTLALSAEPCASQSDDLKALRQEIEALREEQRAIRKEIRDLSNFLRERAGAPTRDLRDLTIGVGGAPFRGQPNAPVTLVEFSDYQCPFCGRAEGTVDEVMKAYGEKVRIVYRDYPLPFHPQARPASEAANCAHAQGKFWPYHAKLFANQTALGEDKLKEYAKDVGLDETKFEQCLKDKPFKAAIDKDIADGGKVGVNGTPAFFINGRMLSGAQPFEKFKELIDEELSAKGVSPS